MDGGGFNLLDRVSASGSISQSSELPGADISGHLPVFVFVSARQHVAKKERPDNTLQKDVKERKVCPQLLVSEPRQRQRLGSKLKAAFILSIHFKSLHGELKAPWRVPQVVFVRD